MIAVKNLMIHIIAKKDFESCNTKYNKGQTYFIMSEYSDNDPSDVIETCDWLLSLIEDGNIEITNYYSLLPESNMVDKSLEPYMSKLIDYIRKELLH